MSFLSSLCASCIAMKVGCALLVSGAVKAIKMGYIHIRDKYNGR